MNYIIWKYFYRKPEEILSFLNDFKMKIQIFPQNLSKICIFKMLINKK